MTLFELDRLKREGKDVGFLRRNTEIRLWREVEDRVDKITTKDMMDIKVRKMRRIGQTGK